MKDEKISNQAIKMTSLIYFPSKPDEPHQKKVEI